MPSKPRNLRTPEEIRTFIEEQDMKYIMVNNRIFKDFFSKENFTYVNAQSKEVTERFTEADLILFITLNFLDVIDFTGYSIEIANFTGFSEKHVKQSLFKLNALRGNLNNKFHHATNDRDYGDFETRLIATKKVKGYVNGKFKNMYRHYIKFHCDYRREPVDKNGEIKDIPINYFMVSIYDLDLYLNGTLNKSEFITYLYLLQICKFDSKSIMIKTSTIGKALHVRIKETMQKYLDRLENLTVTENNHPLIKVDKPSNYSNNVFLRKEPSASYYPIYNHLTIQRLMGLEPLSIYDRVNEGENNVEVNSDNVEVNLSVEMDSLKLEGEDTKIEANSYNMEVNLENKKLYLQDVERIFG